MRLNKRDGGEGGEGGRGISICARKLYTLRMDESDGGSKKTPRYVTRLVMLIIVEGLMLHVVCKPLLRCSKQRVESFKTCFCSWIER